jgi:hypothetical protein
VNPPRVIVHPSVVLLCLFAKFLLKAPSPVLAHTLWLLGDDAGMVQALVHPPKGERPAGLASCLSVEGSSPQWTESVDKKVHPCPRRLTCCHGGHGNYACSCGRVPMPGIDGLETNTQEILSQASMGFCGYVPSCQALNNMISQEPGGHGACLVLKSPRVMRRVHNE